MADAIPSPMEARRACRHPPWPVWPSPRSPTSSTPVCIQRCPTAPPVKSSTMIRGRAGLRLFGSGRGRAGGAHRRSLRLRRRRQVPRELALRARLPGRQRAARALDSRASAHLRRLAQAPSYCRDVGFAVVADVSGNTLEAAVGGALQITYNQPPTHTWQVLGYPATSPFDGQLMVYSDADFQEFIVPPGCVTPLPDICIRSDMQAGSSGGPWLTTPGGLLVNGATSSLLAPPTSCARRRSTPR